VRVWLLHLAPPTSSPTACTYRRRSSAAPPLGSENTRRLTLALSGGTALAIEYDGSAGRRKNSLPKDWRAWLSRESTFHTHDATSILNH
jgi:hypothetical protein